METKTCKACNRELPLTEFKTTRWGCNAAVCNECVAEKRAQTRYNNAQTGGSGSTPFSDPDFDGKDMGEVVRMMTRAKKWLESRGCRITLYGDFIETKTRKLKFE